MKKGCWIKTIYGVLDQLKTENFWGEIIIKFREGEIIFVQKTEQIKISND